MATMLVLPADKDLVSNVQQKFHDKTRALAATLVGDLMVIRCIGDSSSLLRDWLSEVWFYVRPKVLDRQAVIPRIWNT